MARRRGLAKPKARRVETGFTLGGPLKTDRVFFFGSFQYTDAETGYVPTASSRALVPAALALIQGERTAANIVAAFRQLNPSFNLRPDQISPVALRLLNARNPRTGDLLIPAGTRPTTRTDPRVAIGSFGTIGGDRWSSCGRWCLRCSSSTRAAPASTCGWAGSGCPDEANVGFSVENDSRDLESNWAPSDFDRRHRVSVMAAWTLPLGSSALFRDWRIGVQVNPVGPPVQRVRLRVRPALARLPATPSRTGRFRGHRAAARPDPTEQWFDITALVRANAAGNTSRNFLRGPTQKRVDVSLSKSFTIGRAKAEIRGEVWGCESTRFASSRFRDDRGSLSRYRHRNVTRRKPRERRRHRQVPDAQGGALPRPPRPGHQAFDQGGAALRGDRAQHVA